MSTPSPKRTPAPIGPTPRPSRKRTFGESPLIGIPGMGHENRWYSHQAKEYFQPSKWGDWSDAPHEKR